MSSLKLLHSGGNGVIISAPSSNPSANRTITLNDNYAGDGSFVTANSSDKVGIGTASPSHKLHVVSSDTDTAFFKGRFVRVDGAASSDSPRVNFSLDGTDKTSLMCNRSDSSLNIETLTSAPIKLTTNSTERMRIDSSGRFLVGRTSNITSNSVATCHVLEQITDFNWTFGLHCNQTNKVGMTVYYTDTTNNLDCFRFMVANSTKFVVSGNGDVSNANNSYGSVSDVALKENIVDAKSQWNDLKNIKVRNFNFKESTGNHGKTMIGVVAQEVETVSPKLVHTNDDGYKEVSYSVLYMKAIKALQEAMAKIEVLETKVAALEAE